jgi:chorismate dehydratase
LGGLPTFAAKFKLNALDRKIRVGAVNYLNTKPLLYGIENSPVIDEISLVTDIPTVIADMLLNDEIDIGLVPVAVIPHMKEHYLNTGFCIGSEGPVASVCLFSDVPIEAVKTVLLDYQSRTSVALAKILFAHYWKLKPVFESADKDFISRIGRNTAAVLIGDRALKQRNISPFVYDLGEAWKLMTGMPFVFAAWISNKVLDAGWVKRFDQANAWGVQNAVLVSERYPDTGFDLKKYYTQYLSYELTDEKKKGMDLFLTMMKD